MKTQKRPFAFTLIELLIVVAIIAILAAIAVPNFLEAQTRAKVARVKADQRTAATAIEAYAVDYTRPPIGVDSWAVCGLGSTPAPKYSGNPTCWAKMTTPVAYITSGPRNVFLETGTFNNGMGNPTADKLMQYQDFLTCAAFGGNVQTKMGMTNSFKGAGYSWAVVAYGPSRSQNYNLTAMLGLGWNGQGLSGIQYPYDATNGTISLGLVIRTNKGFWSAPMN